MTKNSMKELPSVYQSIIHRSRYSRFLYDEQRRETWEETVDRLITYLEYKIDKIIDSYDVYPELTTLREAILNLEVMPSMRLLMTAGEACERETLQHIIALISLLIAREHSVRLCTFLCVVQVLGLAVKDKR